MKRKINCKWKNRNKINFRIFGIVILIFLISMNTMYLLGKFSDKVTPKIISVGKQKANELIYDVITNNVNRYVLDDSKLLEKIIVIHSNEKGEIITADFNLEYAYLLIRNITKSIDDNIKLNEDDDGIYFEMPSGYYFDSSFFNNIGPRIPIKLNFTGNILSNLKTKIVNYGMNNVLVELYANIVIVEELVTPVSNNILKTDYDILLASKLINGRVPSFYGNSLEKESKIFDVSNN